MADFTDFVGAPTAGQPAGSFLKGFCLTVAGTLAGQLAGVAAMLLIAGYAGQRRYVWVGVLLGLGLNAGLLHHAFRRANRRTAAGILAGCVLLGLLAIVLGCFLEARSYAEQD